MTSQQADLYSRLRAFSIDGAVSLHTFEDRLAEENGWPRAFTRRAVDEYRKFLLLAATAGHPVSPSDVVDQAWHQHLLYTRSYWDELCASELDYRQLLDAPDSEMRSLLRPAAVLNYGS